MSKVPRERHTKTAHMKTAMLIWSYWPGHEGGAERQCRKIVPHLVAQGVEVVVWTALTHKESPHREMDGGSTVIRLGRRIPLLIAIRHRLGSALTGRPGSKPGNARHHSRRRDAIQFWSGLPLVLAERTLFLLALWRLLRRPENRPDVVHVHESSWMAGAAALLTRRYRIPVVAKTANSPAWDVLGYDVPLRGTLSRARRACSFLALSDDLAANLESNGIQRERIFRVPNGVELRDEPRADVRTADVLFVANFSQSVEQKAFDVLLDAWAIVVREHSAARLLLLGDGNRTVWEDLVKARNLQASTRFTGWVPAPATYYRSATLFVLPSRAEGMSNALLEAQSWGLACVVSDIPGNRAVVDDKVNGWIVPAGDVRALAAAIVQLLADPSQREILGRNARERVRAQFTLDTVASRLHEAYRCVVTASAKQANPS